MTKRLLPRRKKRCSEEKGGNEPYIKKPLNAFMIFRKEEREKVMAEVKITDSATINSILGRRVSVSLSTFNVWLKASENTSTHCGWSHVDQHQYVTDVWLTTPRLLCPQWRSMSKQEQAKYYMMAKKEKQQHAQQYPNWSAVHNYVRVPTHG